MKKILKTMLRAIRDVLYCIQNLFRLLGTFFNIAYKGFFRTKIEYIKRPYINLVVNGPSVSSVKECFGKNPQFLERPSIVVNFFANTPEYEVLKPEYYALADPMFFMDFPGKSVEKVKNFYRALNEKTKWPLTIFIPHSFGKKKFYEYSGINNELITVNEICSMGYEGFETFRNYIYDMGYCAPRAFTVAITALYACIKMGFQQIDIYGLDNNYYVSLCLDADGHTCDVIQHNGEPDEYRKILNGDGEFVTLHDYLLGLTYHLKNHEYVARFAAYKQVEIFNHSPITMVDAYPRKLD